MKLLASYYIYIIYCPDLYVKGETNKTALSGSLYSGWECICKPFWFAQGGGGGLYKIPWFFWLISNELSSYSFHKLFSLAFCPSYSVHLGNKNVHGKSPWNIKKDIKFLFKCLVNTMGFNVGWNTFLKLGKGIQFKPSIDYVGSICLVHVITRLKRSNQQLHLNRTFVYQLSVLVEVYTVHTEKISSFICKAQIQPDIWETMASLATKTVLVGGGSVTSDYISVYLHLKEWGRSSFPWRGNAGRIQGPFDFIVLFQIWLLNVTYY